MNISDVNLTLWEDRGAPTKIRAFCSVVFDGHFVVHDIKVIDGAKGLYVVMPSRRLSDTCPSCKSKTPYLDKFCGACGCKLGPVEQRQTEIDAKGRRKLFVDVCHPILSEMRQTIEDAVFAAYNEALKSVAPLPSYGKALSGFGAGVFCSGGAA